MHDGLPEDVGIPDHAPQPPGQDLLGPGGRHGPQAADGRGVGVLDELAPLAVGGAEDGVADQVGKDEGGQLDGGEGGAGNREKVFVSQFGVKDTLNFTEYILHTNAIFVINRCIS